MGEPGQFICPHCGGEHAVTVKVCPYTGQTIEDTAQIKCPVCEQLVPLSESFCPNCGSRLPVKEDKPEYELQPDDVTNEESHPIEDVNSSQDSIIKGESQEIDQKVAVGSQVSESSNLTNEAVETASDNLLIQEENKHDTHEVLEESDQLEVQQTISPEFTEVDQSQPVDVQPNEDQNREEQVSSEASKSSTWHGTTTPIITPSDQEEKSKGSQREDDQGLSDTQPVTITIPERKTGSRNQVSQEKTPQKIKISKPTVQDKESQNVRKSGKPEKTRKKKRQNARPIAAVLIFIALIGLCRYLYLESISITPRATVTVGPHNNNTVEVNNSISVSSPTASISPQMRQTNIADRSVTMKGCTTGNLRIRAEPDQNSLTAGWVVKDTCMQFDMRTQDSIWVHISDGQEINEGWVVSKYINLDGDVLSLQVLSTVVPTP
jgi:Double zinc ribbon